MKGKCPCCGAELQQHDIRVDLNNNTLVVEWSDQTINLTATEAEIAYVLVRNGDQFTTTAALVRGVWGKYQSPSIKLTSHFAGLRSKLAPVGLTLQNVYGGSWRLGRVDAEAVA